MLIQTALLGLFGLVMVLVGLLVGFIGSILLLFFRRGTTNKQSTDEHVPTVIEPSQKN